MSKSFFLEEVVNYTYKKYKNFQNLYIVFPNRRAGLYFQKALSKKAKNTIWSPKIRTLEEFVQMYSNIKICDDVADNIILNHILFKIIKKYQDDEVDVSFEKFYYWGQMLINDFEDIDQSLQDESKIFKSIKDQKEIEETFHFMDKENYESIKSFWTKFFPKMSINQRNFHKTWKILLKVYKDFKIVLREKKLAYKGIVYRDVVDNLSVNINHNEGVNYLFVGFSVLSNAEKKFIKFFIKNYSAMVFWDFDDYYFSDYKQEAGESFRAFKEDKVLYSTFPKVIPNNFNSIEKEFCSVGVGSQVGQAKVLGNLLENIKKKKDFDADKILVLLPNEGLLFPVLNSIPSSINKINVTMGFPLSETPLYDLIKIILKVKKNSSVRNYQKSSYYKDIVELISHPYVYQYDKDFSNSFIEELNSKKLIYIPHSYFISTSTLLNIIFNSSNNIINNLSDVIELFYKKIENFGNLDKEYLIYFHKLFDRLVEIDFDIESVEVLSKLLSQISKLTKIPFSGEPLSGLQVMGVLESRNLDFDQVFILSVNEGELPRKSLNNSFIPFNIRKGFKLKTSDTIDSIYSYLFYRVIQRAKNVTFIYNNKSDFDSKGELSRYVKQLQIESRFSINNISISNDISVNMENNISILKTDDMLKNLNNRFSGKGYISPSAIKEYVSCSLKFYYKYVANIKEIMPYVDQIDKMVFGNLSHNALELLYQDIIKSKNSKIIEKNDFFKIKNSISGAIMSVTKKYFKLKSKSEFLIEGHNVILFEIIKDYVTKIISFDEKNAPFELIALEGNKNSGYKKELKIDAKRIVNISGFIDRIERKDGVVRIIDYKTGGDRKRIKSIDSLFSSDKNDRNDAAFQLLFYALLYINARGFEEPISVGLNNIREMSITNFDSRLFFNRNDKINDVREYLNDFESLLVDTIKTIFNRDIPFSQTDDHDVCKYCSYKNICNK